MNVDVNGNSFDKIPGDLEQVDTLPEGECLLLIRVPLYISAERLPKVLEHKSALIAKIIRDALRKVRNVTSVGTPQAWITTKNDPLFNKITPFI